MKTSTLALGLASGIPLLSLLWAVQLPLYLGLEIDRLQMLSLLLGLATALVFLLVPHEQRRVERWGNLMLALLTLAVFGWISLEYQRFQLDFPYLTVEMQGLSVLAVLMVLEAIRRTTGWILLGVIGVFFLYSVFGDSVPAPLTGNTSTLNEIAVYLAFDPNALLGTPLSVVATIVIVFIFFGNLLVKSGCGEFFIDIALAAMGKRRGSAAKTSIVGSALFGAISGSAVSNVVTTGVMTIPLMKRSGYSGVQAGAIEAIASTGGQLMPPIMGAAAFLMAQSLEIPYSEVVIAALIPALLYYLSVFIQVDLIAARDDIVPQEQSGRSVGSILLEGWHFIVPFGVLLYAMFAHNVSAELAALYGCVTIVATASVRRYQGHRLTFKGLCDAFPQTGKAVMELTMIVAGAGLVIGLLNISSGGFALTLALVHLGEANLGLLLMISAGVCILLGMGMPTTGVYVLLAALVAPALIEAGIEPLAAHMFILYFGMMSMITPPIALAAFSAATITGDSPMRTGVEAMRLGWVAYVVPLLFVLSPELIMQGEPLNIVLVCLVTVAGVHLVSVAMVGYFSRKLSWGLRAGLVLAGCGALLPWALLPQGEWLSLAATLTGILLLTLIALHTRRHAKDVHHRLSAPADGMK